MYMNQYFIFPQTVRQRRLKQSRGDEQSLLNLEVGPKCPHLSLPGGRELGSALTPLVQGLARGRTAVTDNTLGVGASGEPVRPTGTA